MLYLGVALTAIAGVRVAADHPMPTDNSMCLTCHINFEHEPLVEKHLAKGIVCARCHGVSYDHYNDEDAATKPDVLFGRTQVEPFCRGCHKAHKDQAKADAFLAEHKGQRLPNGRLIREDAICTDCHGEHRIPRGGPKTGR